MWVGGGWVCVGVVGVVGALNLGDRLLDVRRVVLAVAQGEPVNLLVRSVQDNALDGVEARDESVANRDAIEEEVGRGVAVVVIEAQRLDLLQVTVGDVDFIHEVAKVGFSELDCLEERRTRSGGRAKFLHLNLLELLRERLHFLDDLKGVGVNHGAWMLGRLLLLRFYYVSLASLWAVFGFNFYLDLTIFRGGEGAPFAQDAGVQTVKFNKKLTVRVRRVPPPPPGLGEPRTREIVKL